MKKIYFSLSVLANLFVTGTVSAQAPTIVQADLPQIGYVYNNKSDTASVDRATFTVSAGSGTAQTWNYTANFVTTYTESTAFVAPSSGQGNSNFPSATMATLSGNNWVYFNSSAAGLQVPGVYATVMTSTVPLVFAPNEILIPTPYTLNNTTTNLYAATFTAVNGSNTYQIKHHANRNIKADAYGSLTTPTVTYPSTLRLKTFEKTTDSIFVKVGNSWFYTTTQYDSTTTYNWLQNSTTLEVMQISLNKSNVVTKAQYLQSFSNGINTIAKPSIAAQLYPNPTSDISNLVYNNVSGGHVDVSLIDMTGKELAVPVNGNQGMGRQIVSLNISQMQLPKGLYFVRVRTTEGIQTLKLSVN